MPRELYLKYIKAPKLNEVHKVMQSNKIDNDKNWRDNIDYNISSSIMLVRDENVLSAKFGIEIATNLINQFCVGINEQHLMDCKGQPDAIEK